MKKNTAEKIEKELRLGGRSENTIKQYVYAYERFRASVSTFSQKGIDDYLSEKGNNTSVNRAMIRLVCRIENKPFVVRNQKKRYRKLPKTLSHYEVRTIIANIDKEYRDLIQLLAETGARISEALNIQYKDLNPEDNTILITGKGDKQRILRPSPDLMKSLLNSDNPTGYIWSSEYREGPVTSQTIRNKIHSIIPHATPHMFRHTFATRIYNTTDGDLLATKELLGHEDVSTTSIYAKISSARVREAAKAAWRINE